MGKPDKRILTHAEVLELLSEKASKGQTGAMIALERALRAQAKAEEDGFDDELAAIAGRNGH